ncbi:MAG TPA: response regulator [Ramlibacter sp.]|uniref:response regulator transcription factor n=1 Tax=Ramlibacter sp. TaxID=1917967 RepID=UPI002ED105EF
MAGAFPVLIIEDSQHMQSALRDLVQSVGHFRVVKTATGETNATDWLQQHCPWKVAIVDLMLAEGSGFGVVRRCKSEKPDGKVVVFSEFASPAVKERCLALGADAAFLKSELKSFIHYLEGVGNSA